MSAAILTESTLVEVRPRVALDAVVLGVRAYQPLGQNLPPDGNDLRGVALACSQIRGAMQLLADFAEDKGDDRYWALVGSLDAALAIIEPLKEQA